MALINATRSCSTALAAVATAVLGAAGARAESGLMERQYPFRLPPLRPWRRAGFGINAVWSVTVHWMLESSGAAEIVPGDAHASPLTRQRADSSVALDVAYRF